MVEYIGDAGPMLVNEWTWLAKLTLLRIRVGNPSIRRIAGPAGLAHASVAHLFAGREPLPPLDVLLLVVKELGGNDDEFADLWAVAKQVDGGIPTPPERELFSQKILDELRQIRCLLEGRDSNPSSPE